MEKSNNPKKGRENPLKVLRPLAWWCILVVTLYGIRLHQRLIQQARLDYNILLEGRQTDATATLDGLPAHSGQKVPLGFHKFAITNSKAVTYATNFFSWYGGCDLGTILLTRKTGTLVVAVDIPTPRLWVRGSEWSVELTNSTGLTKIVPTDNYEVGMRFGHLWRADYLSVTDGMTAVWRQSPQLGAVQLSCNQPDADFQLFDVKGLKLESGTLPILITELPAGNCKLVIQHHQHKFEQTVAVTAGVTNNHPVEITYGNVSLTTDPPLARVVDNEGHDYGLTPVTLEELPPGKLTLNLTHVGYEPGSITLDIAANQLIFAHTNLFGVGYTEAMKAGQKQLVDADYVFAYKAFTKALVVQPNDPEAIMMQQKATGLWHLKRAKARGSIEDYIAGDKELALALKSLPDNEEIKTLMADYQSREPAQLEKQRLNRPSALVTEFNFLQNDYPDHGLFDDRQIKTSTPAKDAAKSIADYLQLRNPTFKIVDNESPHPDLYEILASQAVTGATPAGIRKCIIVCGQTSDNETTILFKVMEYADEDGTSEHLIPIHPSKIPNMTDQQKAQVQDGITSVTGIIRTALGQL